MSLLDPLQLLVFELLRESRAFTVVELNEFSRERGVSAACVRVAALLARGEFTLKGIGLKFCNDGDIRCCSCCKTNCAIVLIEA